MLSGPQIFSDTPVKPTVSWRALPTLFLRPREFFATYDLDRGSAWFWAAWVVGLSSAITQINKNLMQADLGQARPGWSAFAPRITGSWLGFWTLLLFTSSVGAVLIWYIGGWWYRVRLRWSGAQQPDPLQARLVYTVAGVVSALPSAAYVVFAMPFFANYGELWGSDSWLSALLLVFPFWSVWASYKGACTRFVVRPAPARVWFLILPVLVYLIALGIWTALFALFAPEGGGVAV